jgi:hypothetical protein
LKDESITEREVFFLKNFIHGESIGVCSFLGGVVAERRILGLKKWGDVRVSLRICVFKGNQVANPMAVSSKCPLEMDGV